MIFSKGVHIVVCDKSDLGVEIIDHLIWNEAKTVVINLKKTHKNVIYLQKQRKYIHTNLIY